LLLTSLYFFSLGVQFRLFVTALGWRRRGSPATVGAWMHTSKWCAGCRTIGRKHEHGGGGRKDADLQRCAGCSGVGV